MNTLRVKKTGMRLLITFFCLVLALALVASCGKKEEPTMLPPHPVPAEEPAPMEEGPQPEDVIEEPAPAEAEPLTIAVAEEVTVEEVQAPEAEGEVQAAGEEARQAEEQGQ